MPSEQNVLTKDSSFGNDPMTCLLHDLCALSGLGYAEFWKRDRSDVDLGKSHEPSNDELPYARGTDVGQSSSMPGQDVNARSEITESRHSRTFHKEVSFDDKNKSNSRPAHDDVKARRGISRRGLGNSSRSHMPSISSLTMMAEESLHIQTGVHRKQADLERILSERLTWSGYAYAHQDMFEIAVENSKCSHDWPSTIKALEEVAKDDVCAYEEGHGVIGMAWQQRRPFWYDIAASTSENSESSTFDARMSLAKNVFDFCVGIPVLHPHYGIVEGVILFFHLDNKKIELPDENWKQYMKDQSIMEILAQASRTMYWTYHLGSSMNSWFSMIDAQKMNSVALIMGANDDSRSKNEVLPPKAWDKRTRHFLRKYFRKFKGQNATPPGPYSWQYSLWSFVGTYLGTFIITSISNYMKYNTDYGQYTATLSDGTQKIEQGYVFLLINSMGAVSAMLFFSSELAVGPAEKCCFWSFDSRHSGHCTGLSDQPSLLASFPKLGRRSIGSSSSNWHSSKAGNNPSAFVLRVCDLYHGLALRQELGLAVLGLSRFTRLCALGRREFAIQQSFQGQKLSSLLVTTE
mmetsp:Transcript_7546/g.25715  ORF Transcript_7546/g.25715 Transcript_7546/m.25715 type:complete len:576 (-) Transcript_7546:122-1849(-)